MEPSSGPETPSPDRPFITGQRSALQDFAMGMGIFLLVLGLFFVVQTLAFIQQVIERTPELQGERISLHLLGEPGFQERLMAMATNGDAVSQAVIWSGLIGLFLVLAFTLFWRRPSGISAFLGLRLPNGRQFLVWTGLFVVVALAMEMLAWLFPVFRTDFMAEVFGSTTNKLALYLGVGVITPLFEEFLLRGLFFGSVRFVADKHIAVAFSAGVFTLMHLQYEVAVMLLILPIGVMLGYARANTGSIWMPVFLHMLNNCASIALPSWY